MIWRIGTHQDQKTKIKNRKRKIGNSRKYIENKKKTRTEGIGSDRKQKPGST